MAIIINLDMMLAKRKMTSLEEVKIQVEKDALATRALLTD